MSILDIIPKRVLTSSQGKIPFFHQRMATMKSGKNATLFAGKRMRLISTLARSVDELRMSVRLSTNLFGYTGELPIYYVYELAMLTKQAVLKRRGLGPATLKEIKAVLKSLGLTLGMEFDQATLEDVQDEIALKIN